MLPYNPDGGNILVRLPPCFLNRLHSIHIFIREGDAKELMAVKVLLKNAVALVKLGFEFSILVEEERRNKFCVQLLKLPRYSRYCGIHLIE